MLSAFDGLGLLLASLGIYGVIAGFAAQRTNEIGVRLALGAQVRDVLWLILGKGLRLTVLGTALGLSVAVIGARTARRGVARTARVRCPLRAVWLTRFMESMLFEITPCDPGVYLSVAVALLAGALLACWLPARRAAKVDPAGALRCE